MLNSSRRGGKVCLGWLLTPAKLHLCKVAEASWQAWLWCYCLQCDFWQVGYSSLSTWEISGMCGSMALCHENLSLSVIPQAPKVFDSFPQNT